MAHQLRSIKNPVQGALASTLNERARTEFVRRVLQVDDVQEVVNPPGDVITVKMRGCSASERRAVFTLEAEVMSRYPSARLQVRVVQRAPLAR